MSHVKGSIVRIRLENFVTYDSVVVEPGARLNVIIGPNGTGKSTIVCAICLGLAGKTAVLGRAQNSSEFIKHRKEKAVIEITLYIREKEHRVIQREIYKNSKSDWKLDGKNCSQKQVEELVASLNIQVGNLCQFLPQDKVADFAKMTQQQLLESTEKAVGDPEMFERHQSLKSARENGKDLELQVARTREICDQEKQKNSRLEQDVKNFQERQKHQKRMKTLEMKRPWVQYQIVHEEHDELKKERDAKKHEYEVANRSKQPLKDELQKHSQNINKTEKTLADKNQELKALAHKAADCSEKMEKFADEMKDVDDALQSKKMDEQRRLKKVAEFDKIIATLEDELAHLADTPDLQPQIDDVNKTGRAVNQKISDLTMECNEMRNQRDQLRRQLTALEADKKRLEDVNNQRLQILRQQNREAHQARLWLDENRDKFRGQIYGPIMVEINVKDRSFAKYIESRVSGQDMVAFVCEDKTDQNKFLAAVRDEKKLAVSAVWMGPQASHAFQPKHPINYYKNSGFRNYIRDMFDCPEPVMRYLCLQYKVHEVPVGDRTTERNLDQVIRAYSSELSLFYTENQQVAVRRSKYGNRETSTRCSDIGAARLLTVSMDTNRLTELNESIEEFKAEIESRNDRVGELEKAKDEFERKLNELNKQKKELMERRSLRVTLEQRIQSKKDGRKRTMQQAINIEMEEKRASDKLKVIINKRIDNLNKFKEHTKACVVKTHEWVRLSLKKGTLVKKAFRIEAEIRDSSESLIQLERELESLQREVKRKKEEAVQKLRIAKQIPGCKDGLPAEMKKLFDSLPLTLEGIDAEINEARSRVECSINTGDDVVKEYDDRKYRIAQLEHDLEEKENRMNNHQRNVDETRRLWLEPLQELIGQINKSFSFFFRSMKCAGEVDLHIPDNQEDYKDYGIRIKVKYRDNEQLRELTAHHQSGGERSVATILYMMALQELTSCPFRCVDEINQGMDPTNERKVFELVTQTVCKNSTSQYFLLTPKLLPDLAYGDHMMVLCIYNGSEMCSHTDWSLKKFVRRRRRLDRE